MRCPLISISPSPSVTNRTVCRPSVKLRLKEGAHLGAHDRTVAQRTARDQRRPGSGEYIALPIELHDGRRARSDHAHLPILGAVRVIGAIAARKIAVGAIAERAGARMLASAENDLLVALGFECDRQKLAAQMRAVAKRLRLGASATAPKITLAGLDFVVEPFVIGNDRGGGRASHRISLSTPSAPRRSGWTCVGRGAPDCCSIVTPRGQLAGAIAI
jgi:hypothetical protein